jgi:HEAT repeat protein
MAGHDADEDIARALVGDDDPAVRAAALGALHRMGALSTRGLVDAMGDPDPAVRRRACSLAGRTLGPPPQAEVDTVEIVHAVVEVLSGDADASVVECAAWALGEAGPACGPGGVAALVLVARDHRDPLCREAAVAALGAVGDPRGLDTVLGALQDKTAVRRRATIALAAFEGPRVEAALRLRLEDRDWQVRQAAEDLLGRG